MMRPAGRRGSHKRRTRGHIIADLAVNHVERHVLRCGYTVERMVRDYGLDLTLYTFNRHGELEGGEAYFQVKATDRPTRLKSTGEITLTVERGDLAGWLASGPPVILILYDAKRDVAYWLYVQAYFQRLTGFQLSNAPAKVTVRIDPANVLNEAAVRKFALFKDRARHQLGSIRHDDR